MGVNNRKNSRLIFIGVGAIFAVILAFQWFLQDDAYLIEMKEARQKRDEMYRNPADSPLPDSLRPSFVGLNYFPVDKKFRVDARWEANPKFQRYEMPRSSGEPETYVIAGWARFKIGGVEYKLTCYNPNENDSKTLFVPFRDATSGKSTYGGGRYIDTRIANDRVPLDFNEAYNPYCVYNYDYACPIPPAENNLSLAIEAGEKNFDWSVQLKKAEDAQTKRNRENQ